MFQDVLGKIAWVFGGGHGSSGRWRIVMHGRCRAPPDFIEANSWMSKGTIMKIGSGPTTGVSFEAGASSPSDLKGTSSNEHLLSAAGAMLF